MKTIFSIILVLFLSNLQAQVNSELYLFDMRYENGKLQLSNKKNISINAGYDNQPSFYDNNTILFASERNGQTDIKEYKIASDKFTKLTETDFGSEYSPQRMPDSKNISAVRLDTSGLQRIYEYNLKKESLNPF